MQSTIGVDPKHNHRPTLTLKITRGSLDEPQVKNRLNLKSLTFSVKHEIEGFKQIYSKCRQISLFIYNCRLRYHESLD